MPLSIFAAGCLNDDSFSLLTVSLACVFMFCGRSAAAVFANEDELLLRGAVSIFEWLFQFKHLLVVYPSYDGIGIRDWVQ
jgi:hypothetical protein